MKMLWIVAALALLCPTLARAQLPADAPVAHQLEPGTLLAPPRWEPGPEACARWDSAARTWNAVGIGAGALGASTALLTALEALGDSKAAKFWGGLTSAFLGAGAAVATYQGRTYSDLFSERCTRPDVAAARR